MLKTRIITAVVLLAVLLPVLFLNSFPAFALVAGAFFFAAIWESFRLFHQPPEPRQALIMATIWTVGFCLILFKGNFDNAVVLFGLCVALWVLRFVPSLALGLPPLAGLANNFLKGTYSVAIFGCFVAIIALFRHSPIYLLSVMAIIWVADVGAYFFGKTFGKRKLAPSISPGKSWEGAIGGAFSVLAIATLTVHFGAGVPLLADTFIVKLQGKFGWLVFLLAMSVMVAASIAGDLFESQLKRRAGIKDSSNLLPGHGGVLDRIDALIPTLPLAALLSFWL